jgi:Invasion associated locus B (IalB) protein
MNKKKIALALALMGATIVPALADSPVLIAVSGKWAAYAVGKGHSKYCYAQGQPQSSAPVIKRDPIFFLVTDWPARGNPAEPSIVPGYNYKTESMVTVDVGSDKFKFFTKNQGGGNAWAKDPTDEPRVIAAMKNSDDAIITGTNTKGVETRDVYSLTGFADALKKIQEECKKK